MKRLQGTGWPRSAPSSVRRGKLAGGLRSALVLALMVAPLCAQQGGTPPPGQTPPSNPPPANPPSTPSNPPPATPPAQPPAQTPAQPPPQQAPQTPAPQAPVAPPVRMTPSRGLDVVAGQPGGNVGLAVPGLRRATDLLGAPVLDSADAQLGTLADIVIDPEDGRVQFVAVATAADRLTGAGEHVMALPPDLLRAGPERTILVNVTRTELAKAPVFADNAWPDAGDREWIANAWRPFGLSPYWTVPPSVTNVRPPEIRTDEHAPRPPSWRGARVSTLLEEPVRNADGSDIGKVEDLVFNMLNQRVAFAIVTPADDMDLPDRLLAVPWRATAQASAQLLVGLDPSDAQRAPGFSPDAWPNMNDVQWLKEVNGFFEDRPPLPHRRTASRVMPG